jgi:hypothetical protein
MLVEWSYEYVNKQHKELRERREQIARTCVEIWLAELVSPHLASAGPLPTTFTSHNISGWPRPEDLPEGASELVSMAAKLGWYLRVWQLNPNRRIDFIASNEHAVPSDSAWDINAVRAKKQEMDALRLKVAAEIVRTAVRAFIGHSNGIPPFIPVDGTSAEMLERHRSTLAELGWKPITDFNHLLFLAKLD